jgi:hypothetical protein
MTQDQFVQAIQQTVTRGCTFDNPGGARQESPTLTITAFLISEATLLSLSYLETSSAPMIDLEMAECPLQTYGSSHLQYSILQHGQLDTHAIAPSFFS